jgi:hypothetical protein
MDGHVKIVGDMRFGKIVILLLFTLISGVVAKEVSFNHEDSGEPSPVGNGPKAVPEE